MVTGVIPPVEKGDCAFAPRLPSAFTMNVEIPDESPTNINRPFGSATIDVPPLIVYGLFSNPVNAPLPGSMEYPNSRPPVNGRKRTFWFTTTMPLHTRSAPANVG